MFFVLHRLIRVVFATTLLALSFVWHTQAADLPSNAVAQYWGQNSAESSGTGTQKNLVSYCDDSTDILILSFLSEFNVGDLPVLNFAGACTTVFDGTKLLHCPSIGKDIRTCQSKGKTILLSLGGAAGLYGFDSDDEATTFAQTLYDMFGDGTHKYRPFDDAVIDGFDFDIEGGGSTGYASLSKSLKSLSDDRLLITGAPQCPFPDAMLNDALNNAMFDAVFVQFYNNYCSPSGNNFNFATWDHWAKTVSKNKNVKVFLGLPGSSTAASSGYISFQQIQKVVAEIAQYESYGGVMFWDASQTYSNTDESPNLATKVGGLVHGGSDDGATPSTTPIKPSPTTSAPTTTARPISSPSTPQTSSTTATIPPTATVTPQSGVSTCITAGDTCSSIQPICAGTSFAICANQKWTVQPCAPGLACLSTTDGTSIYCAPTAHPTTATCHATATPMAYISNRVYAQLSVTHATNTSWSAVLNARRTDRKPFGSKVVVAVTLAPHLSLTNVQHGRFTQTENKVMMQIQNPYRKSMDLVFNMNGGIDRGQVFVAPPSTGMKFQS